MKLLLVAGARPNFMKIAPLLNAANEFNATRKNGDPVLECLLVHTGQHYDEKMSKIFFRELGIPAPDVNLDVGSGGHAEQTANVMLKFEPVCREVNPDWVVVVGDVNSTVACTLVAAKMGINVAHIEAGLRSFDRTMPEEINRIVTDSIADLLLTPSVDADDNLRREGVPSSRIRMVGNIMIDSLCMNLQKARQCGVLERLALGRKDFAFVTLHRPSNVDDGTMLRGIMGELRELSTRIPIIFPIHPRTRKMLAAFRIDDSTNAQFHLSEPVGYHESLCLAEHAKVVLTDSGGLQEETTFFGTPCLTLRPNTERPVTILQGTNKLTNLVRLSSDLGSALEQSPGSNRLPPLWDGKTGGRCLREIVSAQLSRSLKSKTTANCAS